MADMGQSAQYGFGVAFVASRQINRSYDGVAAVIGVAVLELHMGHDQHRAGAASGGDVAVHLDLPGFIRHRLIGIDHVIIAIPIKG